MTVDERKERNRLLVKNQRKLLHVISDGMLALMDEVEEQIPARVGDELIIDAQMKSLVMALLCITMVDQTIGGQQSRLSQLAEYFDQQADDVLDAVDEIVNATGNAFNSTIPVEQQVAYHDKPEYSSKVDRIPSPSVVIGNMDAEGNLLPQTDEVS